MSAANPCNEVSGLPSRIRRIEISTVSRSLCLYRPSPPPGGFHPPGGTGPEVAARVECQRDSRRHFGWGVAVGPAGGNPQIPRLTNPRFHRLVSDDQNPTPLLRSGRHARVRQPLTRMAQIGSTSCANCRDFSQKPKTVEPKCADCAIPPVFRPESKPFEPNRPSQLDTRKKARDPRVPRQGSTSVRKDGCGASPSQRSPECQESFPRSLLGSTSETC